MASLTFIEIGEGKFVNADQVLVIGIDGYGSAAGVLVHVSGLRLTFHSDQVIGEQEARSVSLALLKELAALHLEPGKMRVITYLDGRVQTRYL